MNKQYFLEKLSRKNPSFLEFYNYNLLPNDFKPEDKVPITCLNHGTFYQRSSQHLFGQGCPECGREKCVNNRALSTDEFISKSQSKFGNKFDYSKTNYFRKDTELIITCPYHGDISIKPNQHMWSRHGCLKCDFEIPRNIKQRKVLEKAREIHNGKYLYHKVQYVNMDRPVEIVCPTHGSFWQKLYNHVNLSNDCPECARAANKLTLVDFIRKSKEIHGDKFNYRKVMFKDTASMVTITCRIHGDFIQRAASHLAGNQCKKCHIESCRKSTEEFIKAAKEVHGNKYDYRKVKYLGNKQRVEIICPTHGSFWQKPNGHISGKNGCRSCLESKGEIAVKTFLKKFNINYVKEYRILPHLFRFDFFLPDFNIYIEFNGLQHYEPVEIFGGETKFLLQKERDVFKKQLVKQNNGRIITISHTHLKNNSVEKELMYRLKCINRYWFYINGEIKVFKKVLDIYDAFCIEYKTKVNDLYAELSKLFKDFRILF